MLGKLWPDWDTPTMSLGTEQIEIDRAALRGYVVGPGDLGYDTDRKIWNGSFDRHPAVILRCQGVSDVIASVKSGGICLGKLGQEGEKYADQIKKVQDDIASGKISNIPDTVK